MEYLWSGIITLLIVAIVYIISAFILSDNLLRRKKPKNENLSKTAEKFFKENSFKEITVMSRDETMLGGKIFIFDGADKTVIFLHDYRKNSADEFADYLNFYKENGYNILLADQRDCGDSDGRNTTLGIEEAHDVTAWCKIVEMTFGTGADIIIHSSGVGAFASVLASLKAEIPKNVTAFIADNLFRSPYELLIKICQDKFGSFYKLFFPFLKNRYRALSGYDCMCIDLLKVAPKIKSKFLIFSSAENDDGFSRVFFNEIQGEKRLFEYKNEKSSPEKIKEIEKFLMK